MSKKKQKEMERLPKKELLRVDEVAHRLRKERSAVQLWIDHGKLSVEVVDGVVYVVKSSLDDFALA